MILSDPAVFVGSFVFIIGSVVGSFLNVCIYRLPRSESVVRPASHCPKCNRPIHWYDNVPLLSFLILRGACRSCGTKIPVRYFIVELFTGLLFVALFVAFGLSVKTVAYSTLVSGLIIATFVDFEIQEIPDEVSLGGIVVGLAYSFLFPFPLFGEYVRWKGLLDSAAGVVAGGLSIYLLGCIGTFIFRKDAMGGGDVKLLAMIGAFLGWKLAILTFFMAPIFGSVVGIVMKLRYGKETIPYGPYLSLAALCAVFCGDRIVSMLFYGIY